MKLLLIQPTGDKRGHYGVYMTRLAQELSHRGHSVTICTNKLYASRYIREKPIFNVVEIGQGKLDFEEIDLNAKNNPIIYWKSYFRNSLMIVRAGLRLASSDDFDGVYVTDAEFLMASLALAFHRGCLPPIVMQINASNFSYKEYRGNGIKKIYKVIQREFVRFMMWRKISALSILNDWHRDRLVSQLRLPNNYPISLIPDGSDDRPMYITKNQARNELGISFSGDILLFIGVLRKDKGLEDLSEAINLLANERSDFQVIIAGFPFQYTVEEIQQIFSKTGKVMPVIHLHLYYIPEEMLHKYFYACDALLLPYKKTYKDSIGPFMKGACTYGLPLIASDVSNMKELITSKEMGFVSEASNPSSLSVAISNFLDASIEDRSNMNKNVLAYGRENSWEKMAERYENLFLSLQESHIYKNHKQEKFL